MERIDKQQQAPNNATSTRNYNTMHAHYNIFTIKIISTAMWAACKTQAAHTWSVQPADPKSEYYLFRMT